MTLFTVVCFGQTVRYVSTSIGGAYDGTDINHPTNDLKYAINNSDIVLLKTGDTFYVNDLIVSEITLSSYGDGEAPIICGYKRIIEPRWVEIGNHIWKINLAEDNYSGVVLIGSSLSNNIGCIHEYDKNIIHGHKVQHYSELKSDWDMWQTERFDKMISSNEFDWLYLYYEGNPNTLKLEFSITDAALRMSNATVENICFEGFGFGISAGTHSTIRNCELDAIGGRMQIGYDVYICYGNGIEFYVSKDIEDCIVENCVISRCYDCGITIQGSGRGKATPRNIIVRNNLIFQCCQGWEDFLRNDDDVVYENCVFENNVLLNNGMTSGFGYPEDRFKYCHLLGNNKTGNKGMIIRNNIFVGGNFYCSGAYEGVYKSNVWQGNTCVIKRGDFILSNYTGNKDVIRIPTTRGVFSSLQAATKDAILRYRELTGDQTTKFVIKSHRSINRRITKMKNRCLDNQKNK